MKSPYKRLLSETGVYAISSLGSRIILVALLPLYTKYLTESEYGAADLITVVVQLLLPLVSLSVFDAVLRFGIDCPERLPLVVSNGFFITVAGSMVAVLGSVIFGLFVGGETTLLAFGTAILVVQGMRSFLSQYARATRRVRVFAIDGILMALAIGISGGVALGAFDAGIEGYFLSILIGNTVSVVFLVVFTDVVPKIRFRNFDKKLATAMLAYSGPLIPNAVMWWLMSSSSRFIVVFFAGLAANGLFAVATRIPSVLSIFTSIFTQAWQIVAIQDVHSPGSRHVYSRVFNSFVRLNFLVTAVLLVFLKFAMGALLGPSFFEAWRAVPVLLVAVIFANLATFIGTSYLTAMRTGGVLFTSGVAGVVNLAAALSLVPFYGIVGAAAAKLGASLVMFLLRVRGTRSYMSLSIDYRGFLVSVLVVSLQGAVLFASVGPAVEMVITGTLAVFLGVFNVSYVRSAVRVMVSR